MGACWVFDKSSVTLNAEPPPVYSPQPEVLSSGGKRGIPYLVQQLLEIRPKQEKTPYREASPYERNGGYHITSALLWQHPSPAPLLSPSFIKCASRRYSHNPPPQAGLPFAQTSLIWEVFLALPCKINILNFYLLLLSFLFIEFIISTSDILLVFCLFVFLFVLEYKLPEGKRDASVLFPVFLRGLEPCVEHSRYLSATGWGHEQAPSLSTGLIFILLWSPGGRHKAK